MNKYKISRRGRKLQATDDQRTLMALPKDVPERTWAEILQREEEELFILELREDIIEDAMAVVYERYMEKQNALFTVHCAAEAWLKLIDWHFYRHDPGEDPSAYPPCFIPKRAESWAADEMPAPSPKDTWCHHDLNVVEHATDEMPVKSPSATSLDLPVVDEIPSQYWFPGKVNMPDFVRRKRNVSESIAGEGSSSSPVSAEDQLAAESEVLQKITDYSTEELSTKVSGFSALKTTTPVELDGSLRGAGDSSVDKVRPKLRRQSDKNKSFTRPSMASRSRGNLPPLELDSRSRVTIISDCRLRNLRLDTQYEVSSEKIDTPPGETVKRK
ncbi:hypothetical protein evm_012646 [Chilo suppressalis]|nr:hypothetical protein evm_012646 [Chilo suppressalis]